MLTKLLARPQGRHDDVCRVRESMIQISIKYNERKIEFAGANLLQI